MAEKPTKRANPAMNFKNMARDAPYRLTNINHATYLATASQVSPWSAIPGWELESTVFDVMHNLFLGSGRDFLGSAIRLLLEHGAFDAYGVERSSPAMFAQITLEIHDTYKRHGFLWPTAQYSFEPAVIHVLAHCFTNSGIVIIITNWLLFNSHVGFAGSMMFLIMPISQTCLSC